jgi:hypothetical protein
MTTEQIEALFNTAVEEKAIYNELKRISERQYNWRRPWRKAKYWRYAKCFVSVEKLRLQLMINFKII